MDRFWRLAKGNLKVAIVCKRGAPESTPGVVRLLLLVPLPELRPRPRQVEPVGEIVGGDGDALTAHRRRPSPRSPRAPRRTPPRASTEHVRSSERPARSGGAPCNRSRDCSPEACHPLPRETSKRLGGRA